MSERAIDTLDDLKRYALEDTRGLSVPTLWLALLLGTGIVSAFVLSFAGLIPLWAGGLINYVCMVQGYTLVHECVHKNVHGGDERWRWINDVLGTAVMFWPFHSYTMHAHIHRHHHAYTNDPELDPDSWLSGVTHPMAVLFRAYTLYFAMNAFALRTAKRSKNARAFLIRAWGEQFAPFALAGVLVALGFGREVLFVWAIPALSAFATIGFILDWVPHHSHKDGGPMRQSLLMGAPDNIFGRAFTWIYLFQNYHLIHHLYPRVPWHAYERVYRRGRHVLKREGARIYPGFDKGFEEKQAAALP